MYRLTAGILLVLLLVGVIAPTAMAASGSAPHACCLRHMRHADSSTNGIAAVTGHYGNCCPPSVTPHCAELGSPPPDKVPNSSGPAHAAPFVRPFGFDLISGLSVRGPPAS